MQVRRALETLAVDLAAPRLAADGITELWLHQARALDAVRRGENTVVVTGTASGKTLCYNLPVLAYLRDTQVYVQATAAGMTIFDLPPSRNQRDVAQWQAIIQWVEMTEKQET